MNDEIQQLQAEPRSEPQEVDERQVSDPKGANSSHRFTLSAGLAEVGFYFSAAYLIFLAAMAMFSWNQLWMMQPNEFGDLMAGVFAPLAFLWLVLGFFQQGQELRNSGEALWLQMEELQNSVEQQKGLVEATRDLREQEAKIFAQQQEAAARAAAPILRFRPKMSTAHGEESRRYEFDLINSGRDCFDVRVAVDDKPRSAFPKISSGDSVVFSLIESNKSDNDRTVDVTFFDARGSEAVRRFKFKRVGMRFEIKDLDR